MKFYRFLFFLTLLAALAACGNETATETRMPTEAQMETLPEAQTPIETIPEASTDNPYLISNGSFIGFKPGEPLREYVDALRPGKIRTGEGEFEVYFIDAAEGYELGYFMPAGPDDSEIGDIWITSPNVVTEEGMHVGLTYEDLNERVGEVKFYGSEIEGMVLGFKEGIGYRLDMYESVVKFDNATIKGETEITQLVIEYQAK